MTVTLSPVWGAGAQIFDDNGTPLAGGKIYTYAAGTTTPEATYTSISGATANTNPIVLNAGGRVPNEVWLTDGVVYKLVLKTATDVVIATYDNIVGINSSFYTVDQEIQTAGAGGQSTFTLTTMQYRPGTNSLSVFIDGVNQYGNPGGNAYFENSPTTVSFSELVPEGSVVKFTSATSIDPTTFIADASNVTYQPPFTGSAATNVEAKLAEYVSVKDFGAVGDGVADDTTAIQKAYNTQKNIYWPYGTYKVTNIRVYADTSTIFADGTTIEKISTSNYIFCNANAGNITTTAYNGDGNISFYGDVTFKLGSGGANLSVYGFVHAKNFRIEGAGVVDGIDVSHAIEMNACADWKIKGYTFRDQTVDAGSVDLAEVIQWDGAFDAGRFPYAPGASDNTTCQDFEISDCLFENIYTAYGAHHAPNYKHLRAHIFNNTIVNSVAPETAERIRHLKDSVLYGNIIKGAAGRAVNIRQCINVVQDGYVIANTNQANSAVFWQTSENCVWGPNSRIYFDSFVPASVYEVGSIANPSTNITIYEGIVDKGTSVTEPFLDNNGINTVFIGSSNSNTLSYPETWASFYPCLNIPDVNTAGDYILLCKYGDITQVVAGTFYARRKWTKGSGAQHTQLSVTSVEGDDGLATRRTIWSQSYDISTNAATVETVTWSGEQWIAIKTSSTSERAFSDGAAFTGFASKGTNQFKVVPASEISGATAIVDGTHVFSGEVQTPSIRPGDGTVLWTSGAGTPEGAVTAVVGSLYTRTDGGAGTTLYVKETGTGNTGWAAK